ncbi:MAG: hypothetical protein LC796_06515 [Acidobacteria bacterium]|nr:hypothetical protein [Acidobacteriota bacterium]MCA1611749.1 hypothetical protein [Acidobacteriota bacterium]
MRTAALSSDGARRPEAAALFFRRERALRLLPGAVDDGATNPFGKARRRCGSSGNPLAKDFEIDPFAGVSSSDAPCRTASPACARTDSSRSTRSFGYAWSRMTGPCFGTIAAASNAIN